MNVIITNLKIKLIINVLNLHVQINTILSNISPKQDINVYNLVIYIIKMKILNKFV